MLKPTETNDSSLTVIRISKTPQIVFHSNFRNVIGSTPHHPSLRNSLHFTKTKDALSQKIFFKIVASFGVLGIYYPLLSW